MDTTAQTVNDAFDKVIRLADFPLATPGVTFESFKNLRRFCRRKLGATPSALHLTKKLFASLARDFGTSGLDDGPICRLTPGGRLLGVRVLDDLDEKSGPHNGWRIEFP